MLSNCYKALNEGEKRSKLIKEYSLWYAYSYKMIFIWKYEQYFLLNRVLYFVNLNLHIKLSNIFDFSFFKFHCGPWIIIGSPFVIFWQMILRLTLLIIIDWGSLKINMGKKIKIHIWQFSKSSYIDIVFVFLFIIEND